MNWKFWGNRDISISSPNVLSIFGINTKGVTVNTNTAMSHTTVYACVNVKAQGLSSVPFTLYKETKKGREKAKNHPLFNILARQVNPLMTSVTWREMIVKDIELRGTHFSQIVKDKGGRIVALYPLIHDNMTVTLHINEDNIPTIKYSYQIEEGSVRNYDEKQILRIVGMPSSNGILGVSAIMENAQSISLGMQTEQFGSKFFENGANGSGILSTDKTFTGEEGMKRLAKQFGDQFTGLSNSKKPIVLENGMKWQPITISNNDSQFLETRQFQKSEIASIFRVSPHLINDLTHATFSNITELSLEHVKYCLMPLAVKIEVSIWNQLLTDAEKKTYFAEFNFNGLMRGDFKTRTEGYKNAINSGYMTPNEIRKLENMNTLDAGDKLLMQSQYTTLEKIEEGPNEQAPNQETKQKEDNETETN